MASLRGFDISPIRAVHIECILKIESPPAMEGFQLLLTTVHVEIGRPNYSIERTFRVRFELGA
jgi:hypothetical protein